MKPTAMLWSLIRSRSGSSGFAAITACRWLWEFRDPKFPVELRQDASHYLERFPKVGRSENFLDEHFAQFVLSSEQNLSLV